MKDRRTIILEVDGIDWKVTGLTSLRYMPLDNYDARVGVVRYSPDRPWVSVKEILPPFLQKILLWDGKKVWAGYRNSGGWWSNYDAEKGCVKLNPTHWQEVPEGPKT